jgi:GWxTD domain-containing protein
LYRNLSVEGKRRFLREFWQRRDPTPATPDNPARDEFYRAVVYANEAFRESGRGEIPGWNTDRGRVYLRNGRPDETLRRPAASPRPVEAWKYTRDRMRYYVFQDETGLGNYRLLGTNDRREINTTAWERLIGGDAYREVYQFLGLDPRNLGTDRNNP